MVTNTGTDREALHHHALDTHTLDQSHCGDRPPSRSVLALHSSTHHEIPSSLIAQVRSDLIAAFHNFLAQS
jgi:hypothetical protein